MRAVLVSLCLIAFASVGCASATRRLAVLDYQLAQSATAVQASVESAKNAGLVSAPEYRAYLDGALKVAHGGSAFSTALMAYLANQNTGTLTALEAALNTLVTQFLALPSPLTGSAQTQVQAIVSAPANTTAITNARKALGVQ